MSTSTSPAPGAVGGASLRKSGSFASAAGTERHRYSYLRSIPAPIDAVYDIPGMAQEVQKRCAASSRPTFVPPRPTTPGRTAGGGAQRDSHIKAVNKLVDAHYHVPGMAEQLARDTRGRIAPPPQSSREAPPSASAASAGDAAGSKRPVTPSKVRESTRDSHIRASQKFVDTSYDLPGMALLVAKSDRRHNIGFAKPFKAHATGRDSHIRAVPKPVDASYDVRGIAHEVHNSPPHKGRIA